MSTKRTASGLVKDGSTEAKKAALIKEAVAQINDLPAAEALRALVHSVTIDVDKECRKLSKLLQVDAAKLKPLFNDDNLEEWEPAVAALIFGITAAAECIDNDEELCTSIEAMECPLDRMDSTGAYNKNRYEENKASMLEVMGGECEAPEHVDTLSAALIDVGQENIPAWVSEAVSAKFKALYPNSAYATNKESHWDTESESNSDS